MAPFSTRSTDRDGSISFEWKILLEEWLDPWRRKGDAKSASRVPPVRCLTLFVSGVCAQVGGAVKKSNFLYVTNEANHAYHTKE